MPHFNLVLSNFNTLALPCKSAQKQTLDWIIAAHTKAETVSKRLTDNESDRFAKEFEKELMRVGCKPGVIENRGHIITDFLHQNWEEMEVYRLHLPASANGLERRQHVHKKAALACFNELYSDIEKPPNDLLHVSCTGYVSPSPAQYLSSYRGWNKNTTVTHIYHMGCYGAIPALRVASGLTKEKKETDIVHTEFCSLHMDPYSHHASQLVGETLFADGCIKYSVIEEKTAEKKGTPYLKILNVKEELIPSSLEAMQWNLSESGFRFILTKEIPSQITKALEGYLERLCQESGISCHSLFENAIFAIHPGGPKILDYIERLFRLRKDQIQSSRTVFEQGGNMSSSTLPQIWEKILLTPQIAHGTKVLSLAFGPGLTIAGALLEKHSC